MSNRGSSSRNRKRVFGLSALLRLFRAIIPGDGAYFTNDSTTNAYYTNDGKTNRYYSSDQA